MFELCVELGSKNKIIDFLFAEGIENFYCINAEHYISSKSLISEKEKVNGYQECVIFRLYLEKQKKEVIFQKIKDHFHKEVTFL